MNSSIKEMVKNQLVNRGIKNQSVLQVMGTVPRHLFVEKSQLPFAYVDGPLPIGCGQTISQPYIVAFMTEALEVEPDHTVLEIGTGCGYQAAILSCLAKEIVSLEILKELADSARERLKHLGYKNVEVHCSDGNRGWIEKAPYDRIIATAAPKKVPVTLIDQLAPTGKLIIPVGSDVFHQELKIIYKDSKGSVNLKKSLPVRFVPMV